MNEGCTDIANNISEKNLSTRVHPSLVHIKISEKMSRGTLRPFLALSEKIFSKFFIS